MSSSCPSADALACAALGSLPPDLEQHAAGCAACRRRLDELRQDLALLAEAQQSATGCVDAETRARLVAICVRVLNEERLRSGSLDGRPDPPLKSARECQPDPVAPEHVTR